MVLSSQAVLAIHPRRRDLPPQRRRAGSLVLRIRRSDCQVGCSALGRGQIKGSIPPVRLTPIPPFRFVQHAGGAWSRVHASMGESGAQARREGLCMSPARWLQAFAPSPPAPWRALPSCPQCTHGFATTLLLGFSTLWWCAFAVTSTVYNSGQLSGVEPGKRGGRHKVRYDTTHRLACAQPVLRAAGRQQRKSSSREVDGRAFELAHADASPLCWPCSAGVCKVSQRPGRARLGRLCVQPADAAARGLHPEVRAMLGVCKEEGALAAAFAGTSLWRSRSPAVLIPPAPVPAAEMSSARRRWTPPPHPRSTSASGTRQPR